jgi:hypothetical protein
MPKQGFHWVESDNNIDSCMAPADGLWIKQSGNKFDLLIATEGPHGSGRY